MVEQVIGERWKRTVRGMALAVAVLAGVAGSAQDSDGRGALIADLCAEFPAMYTLIQDFAVDFASGSDDLDGDELPDMASIALVREVACNPNAPLSLAAATSLAYDANLAFFDLELDTTGLEGYRETIAVLMLTNASTEAAVKAALTLVDPPVTLSADYTQVNCSGDTCTPAPTRNTATTGEFLEFVTGTRATNEPYAADGDLDGDGKSNLTEYNNIQAQGGTLEDFVIVATSDQLDGTEPVRSSGSGCFIATAAYGTPLADQIGVLRNWRDSSLLTNVFGALFSDTYYRLSPPVAVRVAESPVLAAWTRVMIAQTIALLNSWMIVAGVAGAGIASAITWRSRRRCSARVR